MIRWIIFSTLSAGLLYGLYSLTFRRDRWLKLNQWYLLIALPFSILLPFLPLPDILASATQPIVPAENFMVTLNEIDITASSSTQALRLMDILPEAYHIGLALCLAWLMFQMAAQAVLVVKLRRKHTVYGAGDSFDIPHHASLILTDDDTAPYSFFNQIVVGTRGLSDEELRCILAHESHHVREFHSLDLLFARMLCCIAWFNPFVWLMLRELRAVQEFQADAASLDACGREDYLHLLYRQVTGTGYGHITNNFQSINIKKRIVMMNKTKSRFGAWKALTALPVAALLMMVGCKPATPEIADSEEQAVVEPQSSIEPELFDPQTAPEGFIPPEYPDGTNALYKYLAENIHYPEQAKTEGIEGKVYIRFIVMNNGDIVNVEVTRGIGGGCDEEAIRVVKSMPKWIPATYEGKFVNVQYVIPINFKLQ